MCICTTTVKCLGGYESRSCGVASVMPSVGETFWLLRRATKPHEYGKIDIVKNGSLIAVQTILVFRFISDISGY